MAEFLREKYDIDYYNPSSSMQTVLRRPILILYEFFLTGTFCKTHQKFSTSHLNWLRNHVYNYYSTSMTMS